MRRRVFAGILAGLLMITQTAPLYAADEWYAEEEAAAFEEESYAEDEGELSSDVYEDESFYEEDASYGEDASYEEDAPYEEGAADEEEAPYEEEASDEEEAFYEEAADEDGGEYYDEEAAYEADSSDDAGDASAPDEAYEADEEAGDETAVSAAEEPSFAGVSEPWLEPTQQELEEYGQFDSRWDVGSCAVVAPIMPFFDEEGTRWVYSNYSVRWFYDPEVVVVLDETGQQVGNYNEQGEYNDSEASHYVDNGEWTQMVQAFGIYRIGTGSCDVEMVAMPEAAPPDTRYSGWDLNWQYTWNDAPRVIYHYDAIDEYSLGFGDTGSGRIYSDEVRVLPVDTEGLRDSACELHVTVGVWDGERLAETFPEGDGWSANLNRYDGGTITLDGAAMKAKGVERVDVRVSAGVSAYDRLIEEEFAGDWRSFEICEGNTEHWWNIGDRSLLPGWTHFVDRVQRCRVENGAHPDGEEFDFLVTGVSLRDVEGSGVMEIEDEDENGWSLRAQNTGVSEITLTYTDWDGTENCTETFYFYVGGDVYDCWIDSENASWQLMPGKPLTLTAGANHAVYDPERDEEHWLSEDEMEDISFGWTLDEASVPEEWRGLVSLVPNGKTAVLSASGLPERWNKEDGIDVRVELTLYEGTDEKARNDRWFRISGEYAEVWLIDENGQASRDFDSRMPVGASVTVIPQLRYYDLDNPDGYTTAPVLHARWYYDENCVTVADRNGVQVGNEPEGEYRDSEASMSAAPAFTITRKGAWETRIFLRADIPEDGGLRFIIDEEYRLDNINCNIWFETDGQVYTDGVSDFRVNLEEAAGTGYEIRATAGIWEDDGFVSTIPEGEGWSLDRESGILLIDGAQMKRKQIDRLEVKIEAVSGEVVISEDQTGFDIREPEYDAGFREEMFPGETRYWEADDGGQRMRVSDSLFPEDQWQRYRIISITAESEEDPYDTRDVVTVEEDGSGWEFTSVRPGEAHLTVKVEIFDEEGRSETVDLEGSIQVSDFRVYLDLLSLNGSFDTRPGTPAELAVNLSAEERDPRTGEYRMVDTSDWRVSFEAECVWIDDRWLNENADGDFEAAAARGRLWDYRVGANGRSVTVTPEADAPEMDIRIIARAYDHNENEEWEARAEERMVFVSSTVWQIETENAFDAAMPPGSEVQFNPVLKRYDREHPEGVAVSGVDWEIDWYEGDGDIEGDDIPHMIVTDAEGRTLTHGEEGGTFGAAPFLLKRVARWDFRFRVIASWFDIDGDFRVAEREMLLKNADYDMHFVSASGRGNDGHTWFYDGETVSVTPDIGSIAELIRAGYPVEFEASYEGLSIPLTQSEYSEEGVLTITGEDRYNEIRDKLNEEGDGRLILNLHAKLNGVTLSRSRFLVLFFHTVREMEDDDARILTGEEYRYDGGHARLYVEDPEHSSGNNLDDRPGTYYDVTITNIESADEAVLRPYQENGSWYIRGEASEDRDTLITYTFTGGPAGNTPETHAVMLGVRENTYWPDLVDENGEHVEYAEKIIGETGKLEPRVYRKYFDGGVKKTELVPLSRVRVSYYYDDRIISLNESTGEYTALRNGETDVRMEVVLFEGTAGASEEIAYFDRYARINVDTLRYDLIVPEGALFWAAPGESYDAADFASKTGAKLYRYSMREPDGTAVNAAEYGFADEDSDGDIALAGETVDGKIRSAVTIAADALASGADEDGMKTLEDAVLIAAKTEDGRWSTAGASVKLHTHEYGGWTVTREASGSVKEEKTRTCIHGNCGHADKMEKPTIKLSTNTVSMTRTTSKPKPSWTVTVTLEPGDAITTVGVKMLNGTSKNMLTTTVSGNKISIKTETNYLAGSAKLTVYTKYSKLYGSITGNREITVTVMKSLTAPPTGAVSVANVAAKVYSGKEFKPAPVVKVGNTALKLGTDYKIDYANNKAVGKATLAVKGIGNWKGTIVKYFKINPKPTKITSLTAGSKQFKAVWTKIGTQTTGYQVQYSTSSTFKSGNVVKTISSPATTSLVVKNLKAKKVYYVRIRTFKKIKDVAYLSAWSPVKKVTTK